MPRRIACAAEFWAHTDIDPIKGCLIWKGAKTRYGYGTKNHNGRIVGAHRVAWKWAHGKMPPRHLMVLHKCDNPPCVHPEHLYLGTQNDNMSDAVVKGRISRGSKHSISKLTEEQVIAIRKERKAGLWFRTIAERYGVCEASIRKIVARESWKHVK